MTPAASSPRTLDPVEDITRRRLLEALLAAPIVIACGDSDDAGGDEGTATTAPTSGTRTIDSAHGPIEIPVAPKRVVSLDFAANSDLFDLGIKPAGITQKSADLILPEYQQLWQDTPKVDSASGEIDLELIASLEPDLIIGSTLNADKVYDQLTAIAPTMLLTFAQAAGNWPDLAAGFADAMGKTDELEALKQRYEERLASLRTDFGAALAAARWGLASGGSGNWYLYTPASSHGKVLTSAGATFVDAANDPSAGFLTFSYEEIDRLADATAICVQATPDGTLDGATQSLVDQPPFQALPAVQAGHVFPLKRFFPSSYRAAIALLDEFEDAVRQLAGDAS
jgi:iron complex transport system substrate-binding protein